MKNEIPQIEWQEIASHEGALFTKEQFIQINAKTPKKFTKDRKGKGGKTFTYTPGSYIRKKLDLIFGWDWDFIIKSYDADYIGKQAIVEGRLVGRVTKKGTIREVVKEQFGRSDIAFYKDRKDVAVDIGNDLKAAATDALKKCASSFGIASDLYAPDEYREIQIIEAPGVTEDVIAQIGNIDNLDELELFSVNYPQLIKNPDFIKKANELQTTN